MQNDSVKLKNNKIISLRGVRQLADDEVMPKEDPPLVDNLV